MPELLQFASNAELPAHYGQQIRDFIRIHWHDAYAYNLNAPVCPTDLHPHFCVMVDGPALLSSATAVWKMINHAGQSYKVYGLSGVLTYPAFREKGYGRRVVEAATTYIRTADDADLAMLWTGTNRQAFYAYTGWEHPDTITVTIGDANNPQPVDAYLMMQFLSARAQQHRADFVNEPAYFGPYSW